MGEKITGPVFCSADGKTVYKIIGELYISDQGNHEDQQISGVDAPRGNDHCMEFKVDVSDSKILRILMGRLGSNNWRRFHGFPLIRKKRG